MNQRVWTVAQIGAREHYAVARAFQREGRLRALVTDAYCGRLASLLAKLPGPVGSLASRSHPELARARVRAFTRRAILDHLATSLRPRSSREATYLSYVRQGERFGRKVVASLGRLDPERDAFFSYDTGALEPLLALGLRGIPTLLSQIDPARVEEQLVAAERARWPGWEKDPGEIPEAYFERLSREWRAASRVVVNSEWSRDALIAQGVDPSKLRVVPLAYESTEVGPARPVRDGPLRLLFLGLVCLRKGIQYLIEAARLLGDRRLEFTVAGPLLVSDVARAEAPSNVRFLGRVQRSETPRVYAAADLFLFPTLSDGFGITQLEAMAHGLPVIATPCCGRVVTPGKDGLIVPSGDASALAGAIASLDDDRGSLAAMSVEARAKVAAFSLDRLARELDSALA